MRSLAPLIFCWLVACNSTPGDLRAWRAEDHDHTTNPGQDQVVSGPDAGPSPELARVGLDEVTVIAWGQNCTRCHGRVGRGDGPQGPMFHAPDLTNPTWQRTVTDEQIALTIQKGRGQMPPFALPESTIKSLVRLVRLLDASKLPPGHAEAPSEDGESAEDAEPAGSAEPTGSAEPAGSAAPSKRAAPSASVAPKTSAAPARSAVPRAAPSAR